MNIVLDLDGVILQSNHVKHQALLELFADRPYALAAIDRYNRSAGGIPRAEKLRHIFGSVLQETLEQPRLDLLLSRYAERIRGELLSCPLVEGVMQYLEQGTAAHGRFFTNSAAPRVEVEGILSLRQLRRYFTAVYGTPSSKQETLQRIVLEYPAAPTVFFGDSLADYRAASAMNVPFIGVTREKDDFAGIGVPSIRDFADRARLEAVLAQAIAQPAAV